VTEVRIRVNGEPRTLPQRTSVRALLDDLGALRDGVAVAVNDEIVLKTTWAERLLRDDDSVEVLSAAPGG
jgi:sulfur carrier protein